MRETAGSAAAPAARWRKFRRGSFILNLPLASHHSITSSASASSVGGTSTPSALAVLTLMTSSKRVGCSTGKSDGANLSDGWRRAAAFVDKILKGYANSRKPYIADSR